jgi:hypothetical protein
MYHIITIVIVIIIIINYREGWGSSGFCCAGCESHPPHPNKP